MKHILLSVLLLSACGKHTSPPAHDFGDNDKDGIRNNVDRSPYISDVPDLGLIKGTLKINFGRSVMIMELSNQKTLESNFMGLIAKFGLVTFSKSQEVDVSHLALAQKRYPVLDAREYQVDIQIAILEGNATPHSLAIREGQQKKILAPWSQEMKVTLTREQIEALRDGYATLHAVKKSPTPFQGSMEAEREAEEKTYRIYFNNGKESKIFSISKAMPYEKFLEYKKIPSPVSLQQKDLFFAEPQSENMWWSKKLYDSDRALVYTSLKNLQDAYIKGFRRGNETLRRNNGAGTESIIYQTTPSSVVLMKLKASQLLNVFSTTKRIKMYQDHITLTRCELISRFVKSTKKASVSLATISSDLLLKIDGQLQRMADLDVDMKYDENDQMWRLAFKTWGSTLQVVIAPRPQTTFSETGLVNVKCEGFMNRALPKKKVSLTNSEGLATFSVESFVEKIQ